MIALDEILNTGRSIFDVLTAQLNFFGNELFARLLAFTTVFCAVILVSLILRGLLRSAFRSWRYVKESAAKGNAKFVSTTGVSKKPAELGRSSSSLPKDMTAVGAVEQIEARSEELKKFRASFEDAIARLTRESNSQAARITATYDEIRLSLSKIESAIGGIAVKTNKNRAQSGIIEGKLESLSVSVAELTGKLAGGEMGQNVRFAFKLPPAKISTEIADIVRELQES